MDHLRPALERDCFHGEVRQRTVADGAKIVFAGVAFEQRNELANVVHLERRIDGERARLRCQHCDEREVLAGIVGKLAKQQRVDRKRAADTDAEGVTVGLRLGDRVSPEIAARARLVLNDKRLAKLRLQLVSQKPRHDIGRRAGGEGHD